MSLWKTSTLEKNLLDKTCTQVESCNQSNGAAGGGKWTESLIITTLAFIKVSLCCCCRRLSRKWRGRNARFLSWSLRLGNGDFEGDMGLSRDPHNTQLACLSSRVLEKKIKYHMWIFFCGWGQKTYQQPCNFISILTDIFNTCSVFCRMMSLKSNRKQTHIFLLHL